MNTSYQEAVKHFNQKDYKSAEEILSNLKEQDGANPDVLYFLAVIKSIIGDFKGAEELYREVINLEPDHKEAYYNLALSLQNLGKNEEALKYYNTALEFNPFLSEAYNNIALIYKNAGKYGEAEKAFNKALKFNPGNTSAMSNLSSLSLNEKDSSEYRQGYELFCKGKYEEAKHIMLKLLEKSPESINILKSTAIIYYHQNEYEKSAEYYKKILDIDNNHAEAEYSLGVCYQGMENNEKALSHYKRAVELKEDYVEAYNNLGLIYKELKNTAESEKYYLLALKYNADFSNAIINLGGICADRDDFDNALKYFHRGLELLVNEDKEVRIISMAYTNIGVVYFRRKSIEEAIKYFRKGIEIDPTNLTAHYNLAEAFLVTGHFEEGWAEYEWRKQRKEFGKRKFEKELKNGYDLRGKRILVFAEQGLGDAIQFIRYLPMLKKKGCYIIFECGKEMQDLLQGFEGIDEVIERSITKTPDIYYDYEVPLLSLPIFFNTNSENIPIAVPYLKADPKLKEHWARNISGTGNIKAGIVWAGNPNHPNDRHRSVRLKKMSSLFSLEGIEFYSIQKGIPEIQVKDYQLLVKELGDGIKSFADTAAIIENLDLIITVDTSVAHLAGALGKETWVLLPYMPDWRWMLEGERTKWYPTIKLYRQPKFMDWDSVFIKVKKDLIEYAKKRHGGKMIEESRQSNKSGLKLYLGLTSGENFGWGVCSKYLKKELSRKLEIINIDEHEELIRAGSVDGTVFHALNNYDFSGLYPVRGKKNIGYTFFESELSGLAARNAANYDIVLGGSSWNEQKLRERGVENTGVLIQGIDPEIFYPGEKIRSNDLFVIFSGGKFELRKGQDLVLKAVKLLQQKYKDIILINAWYNIWPETMNSMSVSRHIKYEYKGETWKNFMVNLCAINELDGERIFTLPITPNNKLRELYLNSDIGLFPNRCEGGTNLVLMEYMACGKPVVASYTSGHKDILTEENSIRLETMHEFKLFDESKNLIADWEEADIDEIVAKLEYAYFNRENIKQIGSNAGEFMKRFTWKDSAEALMKYV